MEFHQRYYQSECHEAEKPISKRLAVKIGSSTITGRKEHLDINFMSSIVDQVSYLYNEGVFIPLITSGAVACGKKHMKNYNGSPKHKQLAAAIGQPILIGQWRELFAAKGIPIYQVLVTEKDIPYAQELLMDMVDGIPIINANDPVNQYETKQLAISADNDRLTGCLARALNLDTVLFLSDRALENKFGCSMQTIFPDSYYGYELEFYGSNGVGTGGMESKHNTALSLAHQGIRSIIGNGREENIILHAAQGKLVGTTYVPASFS